MGSLFVVSLLVYAAILAVVLGLLYVVIRAAILSALAEDRRRRTRPAPGTGPASYLDADGL